MSASTSTPMNGIEIIQKLREETFNRETERRLESHPYLKAAEDGTLTLSQRQAFAQEQYFIQLSDAISFASLAGHKGFAPSSLSGVNVPPPTESDDNIGEKNTSSSPVDLFQFLLGGEIFAASLLLEYAKTVGIEDEASLSASATNTNSDYTVSAKAQAYPSYWSRLALSNQRAAGAAACAVNFPAWGNMCNRLCEALGDGNYGYSSTDHEGLAFIKFFGTEIEDLDLMAAAIIEKEGTSYEDLVEPVRLLQEYEIMFWDAIFEK